MAEKNNDSGNGARIIFNLLLLILSILLIFSYIRVSHGANIVSFSSLLDYMSNAPVVDFSFIEYLNIGGNWGIFDAFRVFLNSIMTIINVVLWLCRNLVDLITFALYIITFVFV